MAPDQPLDECPARIPTPVQEFPKVTLTDKGEGPGALFEGPARPSLPYELACAIERAEASATAALQEKARELGIDLTTMHVEYRFEPIPLRPGDSPDSAYFNVITQVSLIPPAVDEETSWKPRP